MLRKTIFNKNVGMCKTIISQRCVRRKPSFLTSLQKEMKDSTQTSKEPSVPKSIKVIPVPDENFKTEVTGPLSFESLETDEEKNSVKAIDIVQEIRQEKRQKNQQQNHNNEEKVELSEIKQNIAQFNVVNFKHKSNTEIAKILRKNVIYSHKTLVVLNKPYGIAVHGGDGITQNIKSCLPILSKMIYGPSTNVPLLLCNRLDKATTGILLLAANKDLAEIIVKAFRQQRVLKKYWAVVVGRPEPNSGIIDIPLNEESIMGKDTKVHKRMSVAPYNRMDEDSGDYVKVKPFKSMTATTSYRTLDSNDGLSLVELQPLSNVKHQLRVHMAEGLNCPILGDHKFSNERKLAPQRLGMKIRKKFGLPQSKVRYVPLHLQLREVIIPGVFTMNDKPNLHVGSKYSSHFYYTLKKFRLSPGTPTEWQYFKHSNQWKEEKDTNKLFIDPTADQSKVEEEKRKQSWQSIADNSVKVFKPRNFVKYKHD